ncbi:hypothetical protein J4727_17625 [Providencia rettgeri]|uniref:Uncharacterized protein n=1 Tax=Providencia rettgeri TaxID=587 RepID=A0A939SLX0_PRORE|nr:hypothetical protein [Providencia rettgeri]
MSHWRRQMRGEVFPVLKGRGFRSSSVRVVSRQLTNVAWSDRLKTFLRKRAIDIKPVTGFIGGSFDFRATRSPITFLPEPSGLPVFLPSASEHH